MCDVAFNIVLKMLSAFGPACMEFQGETLCNLTFKRIERDEKLLSLKKSQNIKMKGRI